MTRRDDDTAARAALDAYAHDAASAPSYGPAVAALREEALASFLGRGFPHKKLEDWQYTTVGPLVEKTFRAAAQAGPVDSQRLAAGLGDLASSRITFVDGRLSSALSSNYGATAAFALSEKADHPVVRAHLGRVLGPKATSPLATYNLAAFRDAVVIYVGKGEKRSPLALSFVQSGAEAERASHVRLLVVLDEDAEATVLESWLGHSGRDVPLWTNAGVEVVLGRGARLDYVKLVDEGPGTLHTQSFNARLEADATLRATTLNVGGRLCRHDVHTLLAGEGASCQVNAAYFGSGREQVDFTTVMEHAVPHGTSSQIYKGILGGRSTGVFSGKVVVREGAQKTDARQQNRNLLLSEHATANTKPQLEIYADDVKCAHGATVGQLDEDALFYLRSRGIDALAAQKLLTVAFAGEVIDALPELVRARAATLVQQALDREGVR